MISFESDYNNGMLPEILANLGKTNDEKRRRTRLPIRNELGDQGRRVG